MKICAFALSKIARLWSIESMSESEIRFIFVALVIHQAKKGKEIFNKLKKILLSL